MAQWAIGIFTEIMSYAIPISVVFEIGNIIVSSFLRVAFGGKLWFGSR